MKPRFIETPLRFAFNKSWFEIQPLFDKAILEISTNGGATYLKLKEWSGFGGNVWHKERIDLKSYKSSEVMFKG